MKNKFDLYLVTKEDGSTNFCCDLKDIANHPFIKKNDIRVKFVNIDDDSRYLRGLEAGIVQLVGYFENIDQGYSSFCTTEGLKGVVLYQKNINVNTISNSDTNIDIKYIVSGIQSCIEFFNCLTNKIK